MLVKRSKNLGTDGKITRAMVAVIKSVGPVCNSTSFTIEK